MLGWSKPGAGERVFSDGVRWEQRCTVDARGCEWSVTQTRFVVQMITLSVLSRLRSRASDRVVVRGRRWELERMECGRWFVVGTERERDRSYWEEASGA